MKPKPPAAPRQVLLDQTVHLVSTPYVDGVKEGIRFAGQSRQPKPRHKPKSDPATAILKGRFPPDGKPPRSEVSDFEIERAYHDECERLRIPENARAKHTQLMRCAGRKEG
jgi:hypothetical protein